MSEIIAQPRVVLDDPHACTDSSDVLAVFGALFDTLVRRGPTGWEPALATAWQMSDDARTTTFDLRADVTFHDGTPCDAGAIAFCLQRMARPDMGATLGAPGVYAQYLAGMTVDVVSRTRLRLTTAAPLADLFDIIGYGHIVSPRAIADAGDDLARRAVGTGPYRLASFEQGRSLAVEAFASHPLDPPRHERLAWMAAATAEERLDALESGRASLANGLAADARPDGKRFTVETYLAPTAIILMFNCAEGPGCDPRVRLALNLAIDRDALVRDVLAGLGQPLHGFISPAHAAYDVAAPTFARDLDRAKALLRAAGHGDGLRLDLFCPTRLPDESFALVDALERQLSVLGVTFERHIEPDRVRYANQVRLKQVHDICVFDSSPMSAFRVLAEKIDARVKGSWWEGYHNPAVEALIDQGRRTVDEGARMQVYRAAYRLLRQDPPWLYLYNHRRVVGRAGLHPHWRMRGDGVLDVRTL